MKIKRGRPSKFSMEYFVENMWEHTCYGGAMTVAELAGVMKTDKTTIANYIRKARLGRHAHIRTVEVRQGSRGPTATAYEVI